MLKSFLKKIGFALIALMLVQVIALAAEPKDVTEAGFKSRCDDAEILGFPECASSPSECESLGKEQTYQKAGEDGEMKDDTRKIHKTPFNCLFLQEPLGGKPGYDLYVISPSGENDKGNIYTLWKGGAIVGDDVGPVQALLTYEKGKETQGPFGLLYNYLGLVYNFMSGIIIGFVVLIVIIGGIRMSVSRGDESAYTEGKKMILKALVGMVLWFTASVILYTINPTFFTF